MQARVVVNLKQVHHAGQGGGEPETGASCRQVFHTRQGCREFETLRGLGSFSSIDVQSGGHEQTICSD